MLSVCLMLIDEEDYKKAFEHLFYRYSILQQQNALLTENQILKALI